MPHDACVTSAQFKRLLAQLGCRFEPGKGGHIHVYKDDKFAVLPMHGSGKELKKGLVVAIKKQLGLK